MAGTDARRDARPDVSTACHVIGVRLKLVQHQSVWATASALSHNLHLDRRGAGVLLLRTVSYVSTLKQEP